LTSTDGYTVAVVDPDTSTGMNSLTINGTQQVQSQWFYYREGSGPGAFSPLNDLGTPVVIQNQDDPTQAPAGTFDLTNVKYASTYTSGTSVATFTVSINYQLIGGGPTGTELIEGVNISNSSTSAIALPFNFIQYDHFTLDDDSSNESVQMKPLINTNEAYQTDTLGASISEDAVVTSAGPPDFFEASNFTSPPDFTGATATHLNDSMQAGIPTPGNVTWSFEWDGIMDDGMINPGQSLILSKTISINVPEPATASVALGAASLFAIRRPRRTNKIV
jgi:hypothetical protein